MIIAGLSAGRSSPSDELPTKDNRYFFFILGPVNWTAVLHYCQLTPIPPLTHLRFDDLRLNG